MEPNFTILPAVAPTTNGDIALLSWQGEVDSQILHALQNNEDLAHYSAVGYQNTSFGSLAWAFFFLDTKANFSNPTADLFYFDLILEPPSLKTDPTLKRWLQHLRNQDQLPLEIPYSKEKSRFTVLLRGQQLQEFVSFLDRAIANWQPNNNYPLAVQSVPLDAIMKQGIEHIDSAYRSQNPTQKLLGHFVNSCISELPLDHQLHMLAAENKLRSIEQFLNSQFRQLPPAGERLNQHLSILVEDQAENLIRDYAFAHACLSPEGRSAPMLAAGLTDTNKWCWRKIPFEGDIDTLWFYSRPYRCFLGERRWRQLLEPKDVPIPQLNLLSVANLGIVPDRKQFYEAGRILKLALLQKQYGISTLSTIVVGKKGFESVSFYPLDKESRCCLFKIILQPNNRGGYNLCLFGILDAAKGIIEPVGIAETPQTQKPLRLLLFLVAVAYRDLIVAREQLETTDNSVAKRGKREIRRSQFKSLPILARLKCSSRNIDNKFAEPQHFIEQIRKITPHFRVEHLRELPSEHKASDKQKELAETYKFILPEGFTFVSPTVIGSNEDIDIEAIHKQFRSLSLLQLLFN